MRSRLPLSVQNRDRSDLNEQFRSSKGGNTGRRMGNWLSMGHRVWPVYLSKASRPLVSTNAAQTLSPEIVYTSIQTCPGTSFQ
jgi:hypothetical protein